MKPLVSVYCFAYNHEKYIRDALDGFVSQKTTFPYEVIVHDDASTDNTARIIQEYAQMYPEIIKPIFQSDNQYSKGINIFNEFIYPLLHGKYYAACEGDDYWCDNNKLQRQVDWLENNPEYVFCGHNTKRINQVTGKEDYYSIGDSDSDVTVDDVIHKTRPFFHTSSFMYRSEYAILPDAFYNKMLSDFPRAIYLGTCGKVRYLHETMSVYRLFTEGSWSIKQLSKDAKNQEIRIKTEINRMLKNIDDYTEHLYYDSISELIRKNNFKILELNNEYVAIKRDYNDLFKKLSMKKRLYMTLQYRCPYLIKMYKRLFNREE